MGHSHVATFLAVGLGIVCFIAIVRVRLFGRVRHGFFIALMVAVAGAGWSPAGHLRASGGIVQGERILFERVRRTDGDPGDVVASEITDDLARGDGGLERLAREISRRGPREPGRGPADLDAIQAFDPRLLQVSIVDEHAGLASVRRRCEWRAGGAISRVGAAFGLEGKVFVSEAYFSPTFKR